MLPADVCLARQGWFWVVLFVVAGFVMFCHVWGIFQGDYCVM
jgi:hypothetical protein